MSEHKESTVLALAWIGSVTLGQWQQVVGIASGIAVLVYTVLRIWYLVRHRRDK